MIGWWNYLTTIVTIISTILSLCKIAKTVCEKHIIRYVPIVGKCFSWKQINYMVSNICEKINNDPVNFASIVGIGRGGAILASLMSYKLDAIPIFAFDRRYMIDHDNKAVVSIVDNIILNNEFKDLLDKPVLLVSQRADPGITINTYKELLKKIGFKNIVVCAVLVSENNTFVDIPYYYKKYDTSTRTKSFSWLYKQPNIMKDKKYFFK